MIMFQPLYTTIVLNMCIEPLRCRWCGQPGPCTREVDCQGALSSSRSSLTDPSTDSPPRARARTSLVLLTSPFILSHIPPSSLISDHPSVLTVPPKLYSSWSLQILVLRHLERKAHVTSRSAPHTRRREAPRWALVARRLHTPHPQLLGDGDGSARIVRRHREQGRAGLAYSRCGRAIAAVDGPGHAAAYAELGDGFVVKNDFPVKARCVSSFDIPPV